MANLKNATSIPKLEDILPPANPKPFTPDKATNVQDVMRHSTLEPYFRFFCIINIISLFVIISFLRKQRVITSQWSSYRVYCVALACSDLILSIDGFFAVSELDFVFHQESVLQL